MTDFFDNIEQKDIIVQKETVREPALFRFRIITPYVPHTEECGHDDNTYLTKRLIEDRIKNIVLQESEIKWFEVHSWVSCIYFEYFTLDNQNQVPVCSEIKLRADFGSVSDVIKFIRAINIYADSCMYESFIGFVPEANIEKSNWEHDLRAETIRWPFEENIINARNKSDYKDKVHNGRARELRMTNSSMEEFVLSYKHKMVTIISNWCNDLIDRKFENEELREYSTLHKGRQLELRKLIGAYDKNSIKHVVEIHSTITAAFTIHEKMTFPTLMSLPSASRYAMDPATFAEYPDVCYKNDVDKILELDRQKLDAELYDGNAYPCGFLKLLASPMVCEKFDYSDKKVMLTLGTHKIPKHEYDVTHPAYNDPINNAIRNSTYGSISNFSSLFNIDLAISNFSILNGVYKWTGFDDLQTLYKYHDCVYSIVENANQIMSRKNRGKNNWSVYNYYPKDKLINISFRLGEIYDPIRQEFYVATIGLFGYIHAVIECIRILNGKNK